MSRPGWVTWRRRSGVRHCCTARSTATSTLPFQTGALLASRCQCLDISIYMYIYITSTAWPRLTVEAPPPLLYYRSTATSTAFSNWRASRFKVPESIYINIQHNLGPTPRRILSLEAPPPAVLPLNRHYAAFSNWRAFASGCHSLYI